jgi:hypothetical protein
MIIRCGLIGARSEWDPSSFIFDHVSARRNDNTVFPRSKLALPYSIHTWEQDVRVGTLADIVRPFVEMYSDTYAFPLARSIEFGVQERGYIEGNGGGPNNKEIRHRMAEGLVMRAP